MYSVLHSSAETVLAGRLALVDMLRIILTALFHTDAAPARFASKADSNTCSCSRETAFSV